MCHPNTVCNDSRTKRQTKNKKTNNSNENPAPSLGAKNTTPKKHKLKLMRILFHKYPPNVREGARALNKHARRQYLESVIGLFDFSTHQQGPLWPTGVARFTSSAFEFRVTSQLRVDYLPLRCCNLPAAVCSAVFSPLLKSIVSIPQIQSTT